ncbi:hypothetical protein BLNAU_19923 [Blattamonas nauphoetae]|uniref:Uncharacterized protein n=1 Tax=Blattamonas nauphoetae TaxID=2049346 RepID=A0ABQ9X0N0_9EUKA|nr:hypothetical protein BLNAU_19923 [Blattamonas nauphoetae]
MLSHPSTVFRSAPTEPDSCSPIQVPVTPFQAIGSFHFHDLTFTILTQSNSAETAAFHKDQPVAGEKWNRTRFAVNPRESETGADLEPISVRHSLIEDGHGIVASERSRLQVGLQQTVTEVQESSLPKSEESGMNRIPHTFHLSVMCCEAVFVRFLRETLPVPVSATIFSLCPKSRKRGDERIRGMSWEETMASRFESEHQFRHVRMNDRLDLTIDGWGDNKSTVVESTNIAAGSGESCPTAFKKSSNKSFVSKSEATEERNFDDF